MKEQMSIAQLQNTCIDLKKHVIDMIYKAQSGHPGGSLSVAEFVTACYFREMNVDPENPKWEDRDRFILSKGQAGIAYSPVLCEYGWNDMEQLKTFNLTNSKMGIHLDSNKVVGVDASTGSLGHGIPIAAGTAIAARVLGKDYTTYVVTGDGELDEGSNWEGLMTIRQYNLTNCITIVDRNHCMIDGNTEDVMKLEPLADKFVAFGFNTITCNGNDIVDLCKAIDAAHACKDQPSVIVADTIKGVGIKLTAGNYKWHYGAIDEEMAKVAAKDLDEYSAERIARCGKEFE